MSVPVRLPFQYDACVFQYDLTFQYITCSFQYSNDSSTRQVHSSTVSVLVGYRYVGAEKSSELDFYYCWFTTTVPVIQIHRVRQEVI
jgi:hypothetical protein